MAAASVAASLSSCLWSSGSKAAPPRQLFLRPSPPHVSLSRIAGEDGGPPGRSCPPIWGAGPRPVVAAVAGNYNVQVVVGENEPDEEVVRRFRGAVLRAGIIQECKRRRFFEDKQAERKRRARESAKRNRKRRPRFRRASSVDTRQDGPEEDDLEEEDNWELPGGVLPY